MTTPPHPAVAARRAHVRRLRARIAASATALFLALFSGLYIQMATGNDPALGAESAQVATTTTTASDSGDDTSSGTEEESAPMTTSAS
jgi:hypothetical protein